MSTEDIIENFRRRSRRVSRRRSRSPTRRRYRRVSRRRSRSPTRRRYRRVSRRRSRSPTRRRGSYRSPTRRRSRIISRRRSRSPIFLGKGRRRSLARKRSFQRRSLVRKRSFQRRSLARRRSEISPQPKQSIHSLNKCKKINMNLYVRRPKTLSQLKKLYKNIRNTIIYGKGNEACDPYPTTLVTILILLFLLFTSLSVYFYFKIGKCKK